MLSVMCLGQDMGENLFTVKHFSVFNIMNTHLIFCRSFSSNQNSSDQSGHGQMASKYPGVSGIEMSAIDLLDLWGGVF